MKIVGGADLLVDRSQPPGQDGTGAAGPGTCIWLGPLSLKPRRDCCSEQGELYSLDDNDNTNGNNDSYGTCSLGFVGRPSAAAGQSCFAFNELEQAAPRCCIQYTAAECSKAALPLQDACAASSLTCCFRKDQASPLQQLQGTRAT